MPTYGNKTAKARLTDDETRALEQYCKQEGVSKGEAIRRALSLLIEGFEHTPVSQGQRRDKDTY